MTAQYDERPNPQPALFGRSLAVARKASCICVVRGDDTHANEGGGNGLGVTAQSADGSTNPGPCSGGRKQFPIDREQHQQQNSPNETGSRNTQERQDAGHVVRRRPTPQPGNDAERNSQHQSRETEPKGDQQRWLYGLRQQRRNRRADGERVPLRSRWIDGRATTNCAYKGLAPAPSATGYVRYGFLSGVGAQNGRCRIARDDSKENKDEVLNGTS